ncbi:transposase [Streptomyces sp. NPDC055749]
MAARDLCQEESETVVERQVAPLHELGVLLDARRELKARLAESHVARERSAQLVGLAAMACRMWSHLPLERKKGLLATLEVKVMFLEAPSRRHNGQLCAFAEWFTDRRLLFPLLTDEGWAKIEPLITHRPRGVSPRLVMTGILYKARTGTSWSALPDMFGYPSTLRTYAARWCESGFWEDAMRAVAAAESTPLPASSEMKTRIECSIEPRNLLASEQRGSLNTPPFPQHGMVRALSRAELEFWSG